MFKMSHYLYSCLGETGLESVFRLFKRKDDAGFERHMRQVVANQLPMLDNKSDRGGQQKQSEPQQPTLDSDIPF